MSRHTLQEAWAVVRETERLLKRDAAKKSPSPVVATAKAPAPAATVAAKPAPAAKRKGFWDFVAELMGSGKSKSQAVASAAREHPDLHRQMLTEFNVKARADAQRDREKAADARAALRR